MYRILVADDDAMMLRLMRHTLKPEGFEVLTCADGRSVLDATPADLPDLVVLDVHLPDLPGHEVCRRLKADPRTRHIPVLLLTGEARAVSSRVQGLEAGAEDYLFKPISGAVLVSRINSILKVAARPMK